MLRNTLMMMGLVVLSSVSSAMAAPVQWAGVITAKAGNPTVLNLTPPVNFSGIFNVTASLADTGVFTGSLVFGSQTMTITAGKLQRTATQLSFSVAQANNNVNMDLDFTFNGSFAGWALGNTAAMDAVVRTLESTKNVGVVTMAELNNVPSVVGTYSGTVQAVPEPSSALALLGLGLGMGIRYRKKLRSLAKR